MIATTQKASDGNLTLAKAMGSKRGYDPMPPDQHEWQATEGEPPLHRMWSWLCGHTIRRGHRSPFAVSEMKKNAEGSFVRGTEKELALKDAAVDLQMDIGQVSRIWKEGEEKGLWRREGARRLYVNGAVSVADLLEANKTRKVDCTVNLSRAESLKIKRLPKGEQEAFYALWEPAQAFRKELAAAAIAQARETCDEMDDSILRRVSIERKRRDKGPRPPVAVPQLLFELVQSTAISVTVQPTSIDPTTGENEGENLTAPSTHIRNAEKPSENYSPAAAISEASAISNALEIDAAAAGILLSECRKRTPSIEAAAIVQLAKAKISQNWGGLRSGKVDNLTGLLLRSVPEMATGAPLALARKRVAKMAVSEAEVVYDPTPDAPSGPAEPTEEHKAKESVWAQRCFDDYLKNDYANFKPREVELAQRILGDLKAKGAAK